jgi:1-deoxy-D-xylulose-5-phosphate reductoisomerase
MMNVNKEHRQETPVKMKVAVLGATGSIGTNTLDVIRAHPEHFEPVLFSAYSDSEKLRRLQEEFPAARCVAASKDDLPGAIRSCGAALAVNGIAGAAGLVPSLAVLETGADLALANKETVVMAWSLVRQMADKTGAKIIPVDSEHSAVFSLINAHGAASVAEIILTCSGGPFRNLTMDELSRVRAQDALNHPTWTMGAKITIDSSTLANKGLEVIEAARLFDMSPGQIKVVIHPQSVVHSMVRLRDGAVYAQLSRPDMRLPIHNALFYPEIIPCLFAALDFTDLTLTFSTPDTARFPMLRLAYDALKAGGLYPVAYNAANEVAVAQFLKDEISFLDIPRLVEKTLQKDWSSSPDSLDMITAADRKAREIAAALCAN